VITLHPAVLQACRSLQGEGFTVTHLPVDGSGRVNPANLADAITAETALVLVASGNSETGTLQPISELATIARARGAVFHTDAAQAVTKVDPNVAELGVDLLTMVGHKMYAPKGVGALYVRGGVPIQPVIHGGGQENGLRAGTENGWRCTRTGWAAGRSTHRTTSSACCARHHPARPAGRRARGVLGGGDHPVRGVETPGG
jgi:cysteine desulfurase